MERERGRETAEEMGVDASVCWLVIEERNSKEAMRGIGSGRQSRSKRFGEVRGTYWLRFLRARTCFLRD